MSKSSRRNFLVRTASLAAVAKAAFARDPLTQNNLGFQIYTVRNIIDQNPLAILKSIQEIGYREIECTAGNLDKIWPALQQTSLKPVSLHTDQSMYTPDGKAFKDSSLQQAKQRGFEYVVIPFMQIAQEGATSVKRYAEQFDHMGKQAQSHGLTLCYHNHAHDYAPVNGTPAVHMLLSETNPNLLKLEMDIFWVSVAGYDPIAELRHFSGRVPLLHLKDKAAGVPVQFDEKVPKAAFKEVGSGSIKIPAVLEAANAAGVKNYFVEQDWTSGNPVDSLRKSFDYLKPLFRS